MDFSRRRPTLSFLFLFLVFFSLSGQSRWFFPRAATTLEIAPLPERRREANARRERRTEKREAEALRFFPSFESRVDWSSEADKPSSSLSRPLSLSLSNLVPHPSRPPPNTHKKMLPGSTSPGSPWSSTSTFWASRATSTPTSPGSSGGSAPWPGWACRRGLRSRGTR